MVNALLEAQNGISIWETLSTSSQNWTRARVTRGNTRNGRKVGFIYLICAL